MKKAVPATSAICLILWLFIACNRREELRTQSTYTFTNQTDKAISFDIYNSREDYNLNANRMQQYLIGPGANQQIVFEVLKTYWIDWYSADYTRNNWRSPDDNRTMPVPAITISAEDDHYDISTSVKDTSRSILMNGSGLSSKWHGVITGAGVLNGTFRFEFRKDFLGEYTFTDTQGASRTKPISYTVLNSFSYPEPPNYKSGFSITVFDEQQDRLCEIYSNPAHGFYYSGRDSMMLTYSRWSFNQYWTLVRE